MHDTLTAGKCILQVQHAVVDLVTRCESAIAFYGSVRVVKVRPSSIVVAAASTKKTTLYTKLGGAPAVTTAVVRYISHD